MPVGSISGPINAGRTGVVAKLVDKKQPTDPGDSAEPRPDRAIRFSTSARNEAFQLFASNVMNDYQKRKLVRINPKARLPKPASRREDPEPTSKYRRGAPDFEGAFFLGESLV